MIPVTECAFPRAFCRKIRRERNGAGTGLVRQANIPRQELTVDTMWRSSCLRHMHVLSSKGGIGLIQLAAGIVLGIMTSAVVAIVGCCIYMEKKYPELMEKYRSEMER